MEKGISMSAQAEFSHDFIKLFQKEYEKYVLEIMNLSKTVFPGTYKYIEKQSHGECDYIEIESGEKYDAKLPFTSEQIELLTDGKKHSPKILEWVETLKKEAAEFNSVTALNITETKLYNIMKKQIEADKKDESIIFFFPFPITKSIRGSIFLQFTTDFLKSIYDGLITDIDLAERSIYAIYPALEKNFFTVRDLSVYSKEFVEYENLGRYFTYEVTNYQIK